MGLGARAREVDRKLQQSERLYRIKHWLDRLLGPVLVLLLVVLYLEFFAHLSHAQHELVLLVEKGILLYFVAELGIDLIIYEERTQFFQDRWLDILLVLPFLTLFRGANAAFRMLTGLKAAKTAKVAKPAKTLKTGKAAKAVKPAKAVETTRVAEKGLKTVKGAQKTGKIMHKGRKLIGKLQKFLGVD